MAYPNDGPSVFPPSPRLNQIDYDKERVRVVSKGSALPTQTSIDAENLQKSKNKAKMPNIEPAIISFEMK